MGGMIVIEKDSYKGHQKRGR